MLVFSVMDNEEKITETEEKNSDSKVYEVGYLLSSNVAEESAPGEASALKEIVENCGGKILSEDWPKMRRLAYPMSKIRSGKKTTFENAYFGWIKFEGDSSSPAGIKTGFEKNGNMIRFVVIKTVAENTLAPARERSFVLRSAEAGKAADKREGKAKEPILDEKVDEEIEKLVIE